MPSNHTDIESRPIYDPQLSGIIDAAMARIQSELERAAPFMAVQVANWMQGLGQASPQAYFKHPLCFPMLLFPWWLESSLAPSPDAALQTDLVCSTISGYYYVRLIDNLMDGHATVELGLLPALSFFHTRFQMAYQRYFDHSHPYWALFQEMWFRSAEVTMKDASLADLDREQFEQLAAKKTCAALIPVAAVCYRYKRPDLIAPWSQFLDLFGRWHQMWNDLFTWLRDVRNQTRTYFLSEAERRKRPEEMVTEWVNREGLDWGCQVLEAWMRELVAASKEMGSEELVAYLDSRSAMLQQQRARLARDLERMMNVLETPVQSWLDRDRCEDTLLAANEK